MPINAAGGTGNGAVGFPLLESWWIGAGPEGGAAAQGALPSAPPQLERLEPLEPLEPLVAITAGSAARYFSQALTLSGLASTHFLAAAAGVILSAVM